MKCMVPDCSANPVIHIVELHNRLHGSQKDLCENHASTQAPFCEPGGGKTFVGHALSDGANRYEMRFVVVFDKLQADGLYLRQVGGSNQFAISVGKYEAMSILAAIKRKVQSRPITHTAFAEIIKSLGGKLEDVIVDDLDRQKIYHARCRLRTDNGLIAIDVRPSDAFALAIACDAPILIADGVLAQAAELGWTDQAGE
jgi:hypothetical protein